MRIDPDITLYNQSNINYLFDNARLPTKYCFEEDVHGVATNPTACQENAWPPQPNTLIHLEHLANGISNGKRLEVNNCSRGAGLKFDNPVDEGERAIRQLFYYGDDKKIYSLACEGSWLEFEQTEVVAHGSKGWSDPENYEVPCPGGVKSPVKLGPSTPDFSGSDCSMECSNGKCRRTGNLFDIASFTYRSVCHHRTFGKWKFTEDGHIESAQCGSSPKSPKLLRCSAEAIRARTGSPDNSDSIAGCGSKWKVATAFPHKHCEEDVSRKAGMRQCDAR